MKEASLSVAFHLDIKMCGSNVLPPTKCRKMKGLALCLTNTADQYLGSSVEMFDSPQSALRICFSDDIFRQLSRVIEHLFKKYVKRVIIAPQQQCFPEGCITIQNFQLVAHQNPSYVGVQPTPPNLLTLRISTLYGQLQPLSLLPVTVSTYGTLAISASQLVIETTFDIQKTIDNIPYIRIVGCSLINDIILARVENMGLLTVIVNTKYQHEITTKTREILEETLCITVNNVVNDELNSQLLQIPNQISIFDLYKMLFKMNRNETNGQKKKRALRSESSYLQVTMHLDMKRIPSARYTLQKSQLNRLSRLLSISFHSNNIEPVILNLSSAFPATAALQKSKAILSSINISQRKLSTLILSLSILDTGATYDKFFTGLDGNVYIRGHDQIKNPYSRQKRLRFTKITDGSSVDLLISEYTINTLFLKAHIIGALIFNINSVTPVLGKLIRTSCSVDEVCLSDIVPEIAAIYPNKQFEIIMQTTQPPKAVISEGTTTVMLEGQATFFVEGTTEKIGVIPFNTTTQCNIISLPGRIGGFIKITKLQFHEHIDFFDLSLQSMNSFKEAAKHAVMKMVNEMFREGLSLNEPTTSRLSNTSISLVDGALLLKTKFDIERSFY
ncbi:hypothetical protein DINM_022932 [Dirofilaria immitis]|nr:hypothetical protein [Dirofilaria immitis]